MKGAVMSAQHNQSTDSLACGGNAASDPAQPSMRSGVNAAQGMIAMASPLTRPCVERSIGFNFGPANGNSPRIALRANGPFTATGFLVARFF
jgi:hypothetical protein